MSQSRFIPELGRTLSGRHLELWDGVNVSHDLSQRFRRKQLNAAPSGFVVRPDGVSHGPGVTLRPDRRERPGVATRDRHAARLSLPCAHLGDELTGPERQAAGVDHARKWRHCHHPARPLGPAVCGCKGCGHKCPGYAPPGTIRPVATARVGRPAVVGKVNEYLNGSIVRHAGRTLLAYRTGWAGSQVHVTELDADWNPVGPVTSLGLDHPAASWGREDPRLFVHRDRLHVAYTGTVNNAGRVHTNQLYAELRDDLSVASIHAPAYDRRAAWEKNWVFFTGPDGDLYCVYSVSPHVVLRIDGDTATEVARTPNLLPWSGGELRGGAPPVLHAGRMWHWFHGRVGQWKHGRYTIGLYTFDPEPPFRVTWMTPHPAFTASFADRPDDQSHEPAVIFPAGSILDGDRWHVSSGHHDRWVTIHTFDAAAVLDAAGQ